MESSPSQPSQQWPVRMAKMLTDKIQQQVQETLQRSHHNRRQPINLVRASIDLYSIDQLVGSGAFSNVKAVTAKDGCRYAMKYLKPSLMHRTDEFTLAAVELAYEAHILSSLEHPNILKIRGWAENGIASFENGRHDSFFLILDLLDETLNNRIERYRDEQEHLDFTSPNTSTSLITNSLSVHIPLEQHQQGDLLLRRLGQPQDDLNQAMLLQHQQEQYSALISYQTLYLEKIQILKQIASALNYIHSNGIIFRDLKPNNIGFIGNTVQIFDFGLSRELPNLDTSIPFAMSGKVGTLRYMAPEVARNEKYNVSADVYSFAMVSYELLSLEKPFQGWTRDLHAELVCNRGIRPDTSNTMHPISNEMKLILEQSWNVCPASRGTMAQIGAQIQYLESQQIQYLTQQQILQRDLQQQRSQQVPVFSNQPYQPMATPLLAITPTPPVDRFYIDMSYCTAAAPPAKKLRVGNFHGGTLDDSMGTIETGSLSADSEGYFY